MLRPTQNGLEASGAMMLIISLVLGGLLGEALDIEGKMEGLGEKIKSSVGKGEDGKFTEGFVGLSLVICVGAMAIVGSIQDGVSGDFSLLLSKSVLDFIISIVFASAYGVGTVFSAGAIFVYQGLITALAAFFRLLYEQLGYRRPFLCGLCSDFLRGGKSCAGKEDKGGKSSACSCLWGGIRSDFPLKNFLKIFL